MTTSAETTIQSSNELNMFSTKPSTLQSITEVYILLIYSPVHSSNSNVIRPPFDSGNCDEPVSVAAGSFTL